MHSTINFLPFKIIYNFNLLTSLDFILLFVDEKMSPNESRKAQIMMIVYDNI
jgi:hypothetical protein